MIEAVSFENAHLHGPALVSQYKLRHRCFMERQTYDVYTYKSMEYDQYDNPSSVYLVYQDENGEALGASRLTPVTHRCMLKELVPEMVLDHSIFDRNDIWEGTRFCVEKSLNPNFRDHIARELVIAYHEFALEHGITQIVGMMQTYIWKRVLQKNGALCTELGPVTIIDGQRVQAVSIDTNEEAYKAVLRKTNLSGGVIKKNGQELYTA